MNNEKSDNISILHHFLAYIISFLGLSLFVSLSSILLGLIPNISQLTEASQMMVHYTVGYGLTAIALAAYLFNILLKDLFKQFKSLKNIGYGIIFGIALVVITGFWGKIASIICESLNLEYTPNHNQLLLNQGMAEQPVLTFFMSVIFAPFTEEIGYRFGIFGGIKKYSRVAAYIICGLIFGLIHFDFGAAGDQMLIELINLPAYIAAGLLLCFYYDYSKSLSTSITAHAFNNLVSFIGGLI